MESLVYEDSPLADYLEGEGECDQEWTPQILDTHEMQDSPTTYAPHGKSTFQRRIRKNLPAPLNINRSRWRKVLDQAYRICSLALSSRIRRKDNERFLEQFGYVIVASQLLNEHSAPSYSTAADILSSSAVKESSSFSASFGLNGAVATAFTSFSLVWLIHWSRSRNGSRLDIRKVVILVILLPLVVVVFYAFARRQWLKFLRHQSIQAASVFVTNAQAFDAAASASVVFIQEVELVSRGYRISTPLPPISRLEDSSHVRRCARLRRVVSECLLSLLERYLHAQLSLSLLADAANLEKYYDIYEISTEDLRDAKSALAEQELDDQYSLRSLRILFTRLYTARKSVLCCLLALSADGTRSDVPRWSAAVEEMRELAAVTGENVTRMTSILNEEDRDITSPSTLPSATANRDSSRTQVRRLTSLSQGIRALHAKMHVIREESNACLEREGDEQDHKATLLAQYESIGADLRGLLQEWEAGKSALLGSGEKRRSVDRLSRRSSGFRLPLSPTPSLGGETAVDGSPSAALRALNGEIQPLATPETESNDEEIFEAVALPSRKRLSLTREERIARVKEDRARQVATRERVDANTNMLRELETVIKLRPPASKNSRITSI